MRRYMILAATGLSLAGMGAATLAPAWAQSAPPAATSDSTPPTTPRMPPGHPPMQPGGPMANHDGGEHGLHRHGPMGGIFSLFPRQADKQLTGAEVQKVAEAFLLWNGNRTWKVTEVKQTDAVVSFAYATPSGDVVARFAMDRKTGRVHRTG